MNFAEVSKEKINLLRAGIVLLALVVAAILCAGYWTFRDFQGALGVAMRTYEVLESMETTVAVLEDADTGTRDFVLTRKPEFLDAYQRSAENLDAHLEHLRTQTCDDPWQQGRLDRLQELANRLTGHARKAAEQKNKSYAAAVRVIRAEEGRLLRQDIRQVVKEMKDHEKALLGDRQEAASHRMRFNLISCGVLLTADVGCLIWIAVLSLRLNQLHQVIKVCAWTKQVEHEGKWITLEEYLQKMLDAPVTHGICAEAAASLIDNSEKVAS